MKFMGREYDITVERLWEDSYFETSVWQAILNDVVNKDGHHFYPKLVGLGTSPAKAVINALDRYVG